MILSLIDFAFAGVRTFCFINFFSEAATGHFFFQASSSALGRKSSSPSDRKCLCQRYVLHSRKKGPLPYLSLAIASPAVR